jgi:hypothetical protein
MFEEHIDMSDIEENAHEFDKVMKAAIISFYDEGFDEDEDDDEYSEY